MRRVTLGQIFAAAATAVAIVVIAAFTLLSRSSHRSLLAAAERQQELVARRVEGRVVRELGRAQIVLEDIERAVRSGAVVVDDPLSLEADLFTWVLDEAHLEEITFTRASLLGYDAASGEAELAADGRWQLSVSRSAAGAIVTKRTLRASGGEPYGVLLRNRGTRLVFAEPDFTRDGTARDPTLHPTFSVAASKAYAGKPIWSDLHWSELDQAQASRNRRVVLSVQKAISDPAGRFLGVLRVGLVTNELDAITRAQSTAGTLEDVQRVALLATAPRRGAPRLVARLDPTDQMIAEDDEIRVVSDRPPPEIRALLASPIVKSLDRQHPNAAGALDVEGAPWLATLREVDLGEGGTSGWMVAILAPEARYTADLVAFERTYLIAFTVTLGLVLAIGALLMTSLRRGLMRITGATMRMRAFDFAPARDGSVIGDLDQVMQGLERAKTVVRAMGKYVPIDLVRRLFDSNEEPQLGGDLVDIALMFTDIEGFTTLSERLPPDELARRLGDYLEAMTTAIEGTGGTIDKYIGDAVMAMWGAPTPITNHARRACAATLACMEATKKLYASSAWEGLPALVTRYGIHEARVMVGHFGAPTRLSYTAMGDGVNIAARLEPLCKQYGVVTLVSETIANDAKDEFVFRRVDRVAVKGRTTGIDVFELLGRKGEALAILPAARAYEEAFDAYLARDFERAARMLDAQAEHDPPSAVLASRCRELASEPPPQGWSGVHVARSK